MPTEADTCRTYIVPKLHASGWEDDFITEQMVLTPGRIVPIGDRHTRKEGLRPDYTLFIRQNIPDCGCGGKDQRAAGAPQVGDITAQQTGEELDALLPSMLDRAFPPPQIKSTDLGERELRVFMRRKTIHSEILHLVDVIVKIKEHREELVHVR